MSESNGHSKVTDPNLEPFLAGLTELTRKYKIGITGDPVLFCLEEEDLQVVNGKSRFKYFADNESRLGY